MAVIILSRPCSRASATLPSTMRSSLDTSRGTGRIGTAAREKCNTCLCLHPGVGVGLPLHCFVCLAQWFVAQDAPRVCVGIAADSPQQALPFFERLKALPIKSHWHGWEDIGIIIDLEVG